MKISVNQKECEVKEGCSLLELLQERNLHQQGGLAIARNNQVVPKEKWEHTILQENDMLLLIGASYGG